jgi:DNA (cytosine-5)-methyltransferase 1
MDTAVSELGKAASTMSRAELAAHVGRSQRQVARWLTGETPTPAWVSALLRGQLKPPSASAAPDFTFIDLFAGIGGMRKGFEAAGGRCVFTCERDRYCAKTYRANFPNDTHDIFPDVRDIKPKDIPSYDVLLAGFPCQPFSIAGVSKKNALGHPHGFEDPTQGTLFFDVKRIIQKTRPKAFLLENVRNLVNHDGGYTFKVILQTLRRLKYKVEFITIDASRFVPQHRERVLIAGFAEDTGFTWESLQLPEKGRTKLSSVLLPDGEVAAKYTLSDHLWKYLQDYANKHKAKGNGFGFGLVNRDSVSRTLSARYHKDGSEILVDQSCVRRNPRRLTPRECARLMGFDDSYILPEGVSDTQLYRQFGNSVVVSVIAAAAQHMKPHIADLIRSRNEGALQKSLSI